MTPEDVLDAVTARVQELLPDVPVSRWEPPGEDYICRGIFVIQNNVDIMREALKEDMETLTEGKDFDVLPSAESGDEE